MWQIIGKRKACYSTLFRGVKMKISTIKGCVCYVKSAGKIEKSSRRIAEKNTETAKFARANDRFYDSLPQTKHTKKRVYHLHKKSLID